MEDFHESLVLKKKFKDWGMYSQVKKKRNSLLSFCQKLESLLQKKEVMLLP